MNITMKKSLFASALVFNCAQGDVFVHPGIVPPGGGALSVNNFGRAANAALGGNVVAAQGLLGIVGFVGGVAWQMPALAVFIPAAGIGGGTQTFVGQKRTFLPGNVVALNNPTTPGGNVLNYTANMHTERQVAIAALSNAIAAASGVAPPALLGAAAVTPVPIAAPPVGFLGDLCIYTWADPCSNAVEDNGHFSCLDYYNALALAYPMVTFHIHFSATRMRLVREYIKTRPAAAAALCNCIVAILTGEGVAAAGVVNKFQIAGNWLQYRNARGNWVNLVQRQAGTWDTAAAVASGNMDILVRETNKLLSANEFTLADINNIATNVFLPAGNVNYIAI